MRAALSPFQAAALMLCFSLGRLAAFRAEGTELPVIILAECAAAAAGMLLVFAAMRIRTRRRLPRRLAAALTALYLMAVSTAMLTDFADSLQYSFPDFYSSGAIIAVLAAAAAYCASMGTAGVARSCCVTLLLTLAVFLLLAVGSPDGFKAERFALTHSPTVGLGRALLSAAAYSAELPLFILLSPQTARPHRAQALYSTARALIWAATLFLCACVLGPHAMAGLPMFSLSSFSKTSVIERFDALLLLCWTLCTLLALAAMLSGVALCARELSERAERRSLPAAAFITGAAAFVITLGGRMPRSPMPFALAAAAALPLAAAARRRT